eukprot:m.246837 g.246837  ORF g.246837 m.246837 type:complete len:522 (-) comp15857_c0_seq4:928-2493(-)
MAWIRFAVLLAGVSGAAAYGDGLSAVAPRPPPPTNAKLWWSDCDDRTPHHLIEGTNETCCRVAAPQNLAIGLFERRAPAGLLALTLHGKLWPEGAPQHPPSEACVVVTVRSSADRAFWYLIPPSSDVDPTTRACARLTPSTGAFTLQFNLTIPPRGYALVTARLDSAARDHPLPAPLDASALAWSPPPGSDPLHPPSELARLQAAARAAKADEADDVAAKGAAMAAQAARYGPHRLHPELVVDPRAPWGVGGLGDLLDPELVAALTDGSPRAIWGLLRGADHSTHCTGKDAESPPCAANVYTFPLFRPSVSEALVAEIAHAKAAPVAATFSLPNNVEEGRPRTQWSGVLLDELGLDGLASALVTEVLGPLGQAAFPGWAPRSLDTYHAFSIHVGANLRDTAGESAHDGDTVVHRNTGDRLPSHVDVCEISMNVCLGEPGLNGSSVHFQGVGADGKPAETVVRHVPGRAFINVCQHRHRTDRMAAGVRHTLVVRGLSSQIRRAPAELYLEACTESGTAAPAQ